MWEFGICEEAMDEATGGPDCDELYEQTTSFK